MLRSDPAGRDHGGVMAARAAGLYDAIHDQLPQRADAGDRGVEERQRGAQGTGADAARGGRPDADSGRQSVDVDAGTGGWCFDGERIDTAGDGIPVLVFFFIFLFFPSPSFPCLFLFDPYFSLFLTHLTLFSCMCTHKV